MAYSVLNKAFTRSIFSSKVFNTVSLCSNQHRWNSFQAQKLIFDDYGDPVKVVKKISHEVCNPKEHEVVVKMLAASVNPADINTIQGKYPVKITLPAVPGNEGVGEVVGLGAAVTEFSIGDRVVPLRSNLGTWNSHVLLDPKDIFKVPKELGLVEAATLTVNPCTAYRMLKDFVKLKPGDTVIQNGANSACGQNVIQLCKAYGVKSVNIVRNRPEIEELRTYLKCLGATYVVTEEELRTFKAPDLKTPYLALNCVGGKNALAMSRHLGHNGVMVTYGGMSRDPVTAPTSALIFKNLCFAGFWMTRWTKENFAADEHWAMLNDIIGLMIDNKLQGPAHKFVPFEKYPEALMNTMTIQGFVGRKYILCFD